MGGAQPGSRFVSFVRSYAWSGCLVELDKNVCGPPFSLFPFCPGGKFSLFPVGATSFPFSLTPTPQTSYPTLVGLTGYHFVSFVRACALCLSWKIPPCPTFVYLRRYCSCFSKSVLQDISRRGFLNSCPQESLSRELLHGDSEIMYPR